MFFPLCHSRCLNHFSFHPLITIHTPRSTLSKPQLNGTLCVRHPFSSHKRDLNAVSMAGIKPGPAPTFLLLIGYHRTARVSSSVRGTAVLPFRRKRPVRQHPPEVARTRTRTPPAVADSRQAKLAIADHGSASTGTRH